MRSLDFDHYDRWPVQWSEQRREGRRQATNGRNIWRANASVSVAQFQETTLLRQRPKEQDKQAPNETPNPDGCFFLAD